MLTSTSFPPRPSVVETSLWHLYWQAAWGRNFFVDAELPARIRGRLLGAQRFPGRMLVDYLILPGEIHALVQISQGEDVRGVVRAVGNVVSRWVRRAEPIRSPVMAGPCRVHAIASSEEMCSEAWMMAWRPVFLKLCATPTHYPHGSLRIALGLTPSRGFDARTMLLAFATPIPEARERMRRRFSRRPSEGETLSWELRHGLAPARLEGSGYGAGAAVHDTAAALVAAADTAGLRGALHLLERWVAAKLDPKDPPALDDSSRQAARGRALVACLAVRHRLCSAAEVARHFSRARATLSEQMTASRARAADRQIVGAPVDRIIAEAVALARDRKTAVR